ncbi:MAG TPA: hypothetical protein GX391_09695 [Firmicutes bacterium]|nr:hypothetical protein [Bacillota bacterium]
MSSLEKRSELVVALISLIALVVIAVSGLLLAEDGHRQEEPCSYSRQDHGYCGIYLLLAKEFPRSVARNHQRLNRVFIGKPALLITTRTEWTDRELEAARSWMERGGVLVMLNPPESEQGEEIGERRAEVNTAWRGFADLPRLELPASVRWEPADTYYPLYRSSSGTEIGVKPVGRGRCVVFSDSAMLTNGQLRRYPEAGAVLVKILALYRNDARKRILWDESKPVSALDVEGKPGGKPEPILLLWYGLVDQLILVAVVYSVSRVRRLGPPVELPQAEVFTLEDYMNSLASFYRKTGSRQVVLEELYQDVRRRLIRATGCGASADDHQLAEAYGRIHGADPSALAATLQATAQAITGSEPGEKDFFALGRALDAYRKELDKYGESC